MADHRVTAEDEDAGLQATPQCPDCQSEAVRPSRSSYPMDRAKIADSSLDFWRCKNCGYRFLGPRVLETKRRRGHRRGHHSDRSLNRGNEAGSTGRGWIVPVVILAAIIAALYLFG